MAGVSWKMGHFDCAFLPDQLSVCSGGKVGITNTASSWEICFFCGCAFHRDCLHAVKLKHLSFYSSLTFSKIIVQFFFCEECYFRNITRF